MTKVVILSLYPEKATRVRLQAWSLQKAGYEVEIRGPPFNKKVFGRLASAFFRYLSHFIQAAIVDADIIHFSNIPEFPGLGLLFRKKPKIVYDIRSPFASNMYEFSHSEFVLKTSLGIEKLLCKKADLVITANKLMEKRALKLGAKNTATVPNYPPPSLKALIPREELRDSLGAREEDIVYFIVTYLTAQKPFKELFLAFKRLQQRKPNTWLWVIGDGPEKENLQRFASQLSPRILFLGWKEYKELGSYINAGDIGLAIYRPYPKIAPTYFSVENVWKVSEYAFFGKPVVGTYMVASPGVLPATLENLDEVMEQAISIKTTSIPVRTWKDSEKILLEKYYDLIPP